MKDWLISHKIYGRVDVKRLTLSNNKTLTIVSGEVYCSDKKYKEFYEEILNRYSALGLQYSVKHNPVEFKEKENIEVKDIIEQGDELDKVETLYVGMINIDLITPNKEYKLINATNKLKIANVVRVLGVISPILVDEHLRVIDGDLRLELAHEFKMKEVPVMVVKAGKDKADTLRLLLNRSCEFQRWNFKEVDPFVDSIPQVQPLMEPLGFFGQTLLPTSFFSKTVIEYIIDPFNKKQQQYRQEIPLAEWAEFRRKQMEEAVIEKYKKKPEKDKKTLVSLFDLKPKESDFILVHNPYPEGKALMDKWDKIGEEITEKNDEIRRAYAEERGLDWQIEHQTSKDVVNRAKEEFIEKIQNSDLTQAQKEEVIYNAENYALMSLPEIYKIFHVKENSKDNLIKDYNKELKAIIGNFLLIDKKDKKELNNTLKTFITNLGKQDLNEEQIESLVENFKAIIEGNHEKDVEEQLEIIDKLKEFVETGYLDLISEV